MNSNEGKGGRVKESIHILKKLQSIGIHPQHPSYTETKKILDMWISTAAESENIIEFKSLKRIGILNLPAFGNQSSFLLKATEELEEIYAD